MSNTVEVPSVPSGKIVGILTEILGVLSVFVYSLVSKSLSRAV